MTEVQQRRSLRLKQLTQELGRATLCDLPVDLGRWTLVEEDEGSADNGGPWWTVSDDWHELLESSAAQEYPEDWPARMIFDLDSKAGFPVALCYKAEVPDDA